MLRRRLLSSAALALVFGFAPGDRLEAQTFPSTLTAQCVGGSLGCRQVDFFLILGAGNSTTLDFFSLMLTSPGWAFLDPNMSDATDSAGDDPFLDPTILSPQSVAADFIFGALVNDQAPLRMRFELVAFQSNINTLSAEYVGGTSTDPRAVAGVIGTSTVPEPISMVLLGTGLAGLGYARRRSRSRRDV